MIQDIDMIIAMTTWCPQYYWCYSYLEETGLNKLHNLRSKASVFLSHHGEHVNDRLRIKGQIF